jgi:hypothetical protein
MAIAREVAVAEVICQDDDHIRMLARLSGTSALAAAAGKEGNRQDQPDTIFGDARRSHGRMNADLRDNKNGEIVASKDALPLK